MSDEVYRIARDDFKVPGAAAMQDPELLGRVIAEATQAGRISVDGEVRPARGSERTAAPASKPVFASYPPHSAEFVQLIGKTVAQAITDLREPWSITDTENVRVYVSGNLVAPENFSAVQLKAGDRLELQRQAGEKGA